MTEPDRLAGFWLFLGSALIAQVMEFIRSCLLTILHAADATELFITYSAVQDDFFATSWKKYFVVAREDPTGG